MDKSVDAALLDACVEVLAEEGFGRLSLAKVAARARSSRAAIYRRWASKTEMALAAVNRLFERSLVEFSRSGDVHTDVRALLHDAVGLLSSRNNAKAIASLVAAAHHLAEQPDLRDFVRARRGIVLRQVLEDGVKCGQLPKDFNIETAIDTLIGPVFYRFLIIGMPMDAAEVDALVSACLGPASG